MTNLPEALKQLVASHKTATYVNKTAFQSTADHWWTGY